MSGTTTHGWPYVTPDDHPKEYPAASQQLAEKLEAQPRVQAGFINTGQLVNPGAAHGFDIVFPVPYTSAPIVTANASSAQYGTVVFDAIGPTAARAIFIANLGQAAFAAINWTAVGN